MQSRVLGAIIAGLLANAGPAAADTLTPVPAVSGADPGSTFAAAVNDSDMIGGAYTTGGGTTSHGFVGTLGGSYTTFDYSAAGFTTTGTYVRGINDAGYAIGYATDASTNIRNFIRSPGGTITTLVNPLTGNPLDRISQGINSAGSVVGAYFTTPSTIAGYILAPGGATITTLVDPLAVNVTQGRGINDSGTVVGLYLVSGVANGFIYSGGTYTTLDDPLGVNGTILEGINNAGDIVGNYTDASGHSNAFFYDPVSATFTTIDVPGATDSLAFQINNLDQVTLTSDTASYIWSPSSVPEPATLSLLGLALAGLGFSRKRQRA